MGGGRVEIRSEYGGWVDNLYWKLERRVRFLILSVSAPSKDMDYFCSYIAEDITYMQK